jgi:hypothetical protein
LDVHDALGVAVGVLGGELGGGEKDYHEQLFRQQLFYWKTGKRISVAIPRFGSTIPPPDSLVA